MHVVQKLHQKIFQLSERPSESPLSSMWRLSVFVLTSWAALTMAGCQAIEETASVLDVPTDVEQQRCQAELDTVYALGRQ